jgi:hypothetical protein
MGFKFIYETETHRVSFEVDKHTSLPDILEHLEYFLRGSGFHFEGNLDIITDDFDSLEKENEDCDYKALPEDII